MTSADPQVQTERHQAATTPEEALRRLREGNARFVAGKLLERPWPLQVEATSAGQFPFAAVLGCIDSRVPVETVFDQGIGDIFTTRVAGNVVSEDVLASLEFATAVAGAKAIVVLGHTACGAVDAAVRSRTSDDGRFDDPRWTHLAGLVGKLDPAIDAAEREADVGAADFADRVSETNVRLVTESIHEASRVLGDLAESGDIVIVGAIYDVRGGAVRFL